MSKKTLSSGVMAPEIPADVAARRKLSAEENKKQAKRREERDAELVSGVFKNLESPGTAGALGILRFGYKGPGVKEFTFYELVDGERYTIPRGVARHLNNNCFYREYKQLDQQDGVNVYTAFDANGQMKTKDYQASRKVHRFAFHSLDFMDDEAEMMPVDIVEVTKSN